MKREISPRKHIIVAAVILIVAAGAYFILENSAGRNRLPEELAAQEITDYQGEKLDSVNDFRENSIKGPQHVDKEGYALKIKGLEGGDISYSYDDIVNGNQAYQKVVTLNCVEGWSAKILWEGFLVRDLVKGHKIPDSAKTIIFRAADGYSTSFPVSYVTGNDIIMAYKMNGLDLPPERGWPFHLVAEQKWGYKWIKWITEIEFSADENYKGYWESRGYSDTGNLDENFLK